MAIYPYSFTLPPVNKQDIPSNGVPGEFLGISAGGVLDWLPVSGGSGTGDLLAANNLSELTPTAGTARTNLGLGTSDSPTFANLTLTSPSLSSSAPVTISQTWGTTGTYTAAKINVTETATANPASRLLDLQIGGVTTASINKAGQFFAGSASQFLSLIQSDAYIRNVSSGRAASLWAEECRIVGGPLVFSDSPNVNISTISAGVALYKEAANTLALRNGTSAQTFNVYGTYTSGSVYERMFMRYNGTDLAFQVGAETLGATARPLQLWTGGASRLHITTAGNVGIGTTAPLATLHVNGADVDQDTKRVALFQSNDTNINGNFSVVGITSADLVVNTFDHRLLDLDYAGAGAAATGTYIRMLRGGVERAGIGLASDEFVITTGATEKLRVSASGNVGIGTTAPTAPLEIRGTAVSDIREPLLKCTVSDAGNDAFHVFNGTSANNRFIPGFSGSVFANVGSLIFSGQTTAANDNGIVPLTLYVGRLTSSETDPNNGTLTTVSTRPLFGWYNHTTSLMLMAANGNLGIGTTAPSEKLDVAGNAQFVGTSPYLNLKSSTSGNYYIQSNANVIGTGSGNYLGYLAGNGRGHTWCEGTTSRMMIEPTTGNVGIGTTSPTSKLHVVGDAMLTGQLLGGDYTVGTVATATQANVAITNNHTGQTNSSVVITPKGTGAFILGPKPDGTAVGGNARGNYAVDHQLDRSAASDVASGPNSCIGGGQRNVASGAYSVVAGGQVTTASGSNSFAGGGLGVTASGSNSFAGGGQTNTASGAHSVVSGGTNNTASESFAFVNGGRNGLANRYALNAHSAGQFSQVGDAQKTTAVFRNKTTTNAAVELFLDGALSRYTVTSGKIISMLINITGTKSDGSAVAHYVRQYSIKNIGGTTSEVYAAVTVGTDNAAGTSIALSADNTNDSLKIEVTGVTSETWRWVASVDAVEVGHGV